MVDQGQEQTVFVPKPGVDRTGACPGPPGNGAQGYPPDTDLGSAIYVRVYITFWMIQNIVMKHWFEFNMNVPLSSSAQLIK